MSTILGWQQLTTVMSLTPGKTTQIGTSLSLSESHPAALSSSKTGNQYFQNPSALIAGEQIGNPAESLLALQHSSRSTATLGTEEALVILVSFTDLSSTRSASDISSEIFTTVNKYYLEVSFGQFSITGDVIGWSQLPHTEAYYGADYANIRDDPNRDGVSESWWLIRDAIQAVDSYVNFTAYDSVLVLHAGYGQESSSSSNNIWSAHWDSLNIGTNDGVTITAGIIVPEYENNGSTIGVIAHEYGHEIGLPDLYHSGHAGEDDYVGRWDLMAYGNWNGYPQGSTPAHPTSFCKIKLGWIAAQHIAIVESLGTQTIVVDPLELYSNGIMAVKIPITTSQYYLVEVRQNTGYDTALPSSGVLITMVSERRFSGQGIVIVIDSTPSTSTLNDASFTANREFDDKANSIKIRIVSEGYNSFSIEVAKSPSTTVMLAILATLVSVVAPVSAFLVIEIVLRRRRRRKQAPENLDSGTSNPVSG